MNFLGTYLYQTLSILFPQSLTPEYLTRFADADLEKYLVQKGINPEAIRETIDLAHINQEVVKIIHREKAPHWGVIKNWNELNRIRLQNLKNHHASRNEPPKDSSIPSDAEWIAIQAFDDPKSCYHIPGIEPGKRKTDPNQEIKINRLKAEQMRRDMVSLGLINSKRLNDILVSYDTPPVVDATREELRDDEILSFLGG